MSSGWVVAAGKAPFSSAPLWYLTRSTGIVSFVLMTIALAFGVAATQRAMASASWPRFATQTLHRNVSLLALALLIAHIVTTTVDKFVAVDWINVVVPFTSTYHRTKLGLGTVAFDIFLIVIVTSLLRLRMPQRVWRGTHLAVYVAWPISLLHYLTLGTDADSGALGLWLALACASAVCVAVGVRIVTFRPHGTAATR